MISVKLLCLFQFFVSVLYGKRENVWDQGLKLLVMQIPDVFVIADDESHPPQVVITNGDTNPRPQPLIIVSPESAHRSQPSCLRERDDSCPPQVVITNGENNPLQQPSIVVSAGSQHPSHYRRDVRYSFDSADLLSPREKNISFWRANSLNSTFSTMDDDDEDDEELARLVDQVKIMPLKRSKSGFSID